MKDVYEVIWHGLLMSTTDISNDILASVSQITLYTMGSVFTAGISYSELCSYVLLCNHTGNHCIYLTVHTKLHTRMLPNRTTA